MILYQKHVKDSTLIIGLKLMIYLLLQTPEHLFKRKVSWLEDLLALFFKLVLNSLNKKDGKKIKQKELSAFLVIQLETTSLNFFLHNGVLRISFYHMRIYQRKDIFLKEFL